MAVKHQSKTAQDAQAGKGPRIAPLAKRFDKLLIANRGEIACRIMRTAKKLGLRTVAVYSEADEGALHVSAADEAICIGAPTATESYLRIDKIIEAAKRSGAEAVHPGYGFLSENEEFAAACANAGLVFVGPSAASIHAMASKSAARQLMVAAGVPVVPGYHEAAQDERSLLAAADHIGYPLLIKPVAGGGGKGMRIVTEQAEFSEALAGAKREATRSFANDRVLLERYVTGGRHVEVQIFGDTFGNVVSLFERDCTLQRRYQKVIEEAPAAWLAPQRREGLHEAARKAAQAVNYVSAGTVEFIANDKEFYFLEMNTRLQVEHPVTEMITGLDLVEWQLCVAFGQQLPLAQNAIQATGHAIEARIYAEDPDHDLLPSTGAIAAWHTPETSADIRIDTGFRAGAVVTQYYDPMLAKLIVKAADRIAALDKLDGALRDFAVGGVATNISLLRELIARKEVRADTYDTHFIDRHLADGAAVSISPSDLAYACAAALINERANTGTYSPWGRQDGWMIAGVRRRKLGFERRGAIHEATIVYARGGLLLEIEGSAKPFKFIPRNDNSDFDVFFDGAKASGTAVWSGRTLTLATQDATYGLYWLDPFAVMQGEAAGGGHGLVAPMSGTVTRIMAEPGATLERGSAVLVIESMKMEHVVRAASSGKLTAINCAIGDFVQQGAQLADFEASN